MVHLVLYGLLAIALAGALFLVAARFLPAGEQIAPSLRDEPLWELPNHTVSADQVEAVRLPVALRGYRFVETDLLIDRLAREIRARDELIAQLRGGVPLDGSSAVAGPATTDATYEAQPLPFEDAPRVVRPPYGPPPSAPDYRPPPVEHGNYAPPHAPAAAAGTPEQPTGFPIPQERYRYSAPNGIPAPPWAVVPAATPPQSGDAEAAPSDA